MVDINKKRIDAGKFKYRIVLQKYEAIEDDIGNQKETWSDYKKLYADINGLHGQEYWAAVAQGQEDTITFTVRWSKGIDNLAQEKELTRYRIAFKNAYYDIKSYDNVSYQNRIVKIKAVSKNESIN